LPKAHVSHFICSKCCVSLPAESYYTHYIEDQEGLEYGTGNCRLWRIPIWFMHSPLSIFALLMFTPLKIRCSFITKSNTIRHKVNTFVGNLFHISSEHHICGFTENFPTNCTYINIVMCKLLPNQPMFLVPKNKNLALFKEIWWE